MESERREITEQRFTSLDRRIMREALTQNENPAGNYFEVTRSPAQAELSEMARTRANHEASRLAVLQRMGLAASTGGTNWRVRRDFDQVLRAMQRSGDRQKTLASHGALMSHERLPMTTLEIRDLTSVEGRILVHGEDEVSGRSYIMLESTDAHVYYINRTPEMGELRSRGRLKTNSFVRLRKLSTVRGPEVDVVDLGDSEAMLRNKAHLRETVRDMIKRGIVPQADSWNGWLGRHQRALCEAAASLEQPQRDRERQP